MAHNEQNPRGDALHGPSDEYRPPTLIVLGTLAELTQKTVGGDDTTTFLGLPIS